MGAPHDQTKLVPEFVHNLYVLTSSVIFMLSQPVLRVLSGAYCLSQD